jgi:hypothetical protein
VLEGRDDADEVPVVQVLEVLQAQFAAVVREVDRVHVPRNLLTTRVRRAENVLIALHIGTIGTIFAGVDVITTIFGDFRLFSANTLAIFSKKTMLPMIKFLHYLALILVKNANFVPFVSENILKIIKSVAVL